MQIQATRIQNEGETVIVNWRNYLNRQCSTPATHTVL